MHIIPTVLLSPLLKFFQFLYLFIAIQFTFIVNFQWHPRHTHSPIYYLCNPCVYPRVFTHSQIRKNNNKKSISKDRIRVSDPGVSSFRLQHPSILCHLVESAVVYMLCYKEEDEDGEETKNRRRK